MKYISRALWQRGRSFATCWSCDADLPKAVLSCDGCGRIQPLADPRDFFAILNTCVCARNGESRRALAVMSDPTDEQASNRIWTKCSGNSARNSDGFIQTSSVPNPRCKPRIQHTRRLNDFWACFAGGAAHQLEQLCAGESCVPSAARPSSKDEPSGTCARRRSVPSGQT